MRFLRSTALIVTLGLLTPCAAFAEQPSPSGQDAAERQGEAEALAKRAFEAYSKNDYTTALALYQQALQIAPAAAIYFNIASIYGFEDGMLVHGLAGAALVAVLAAKVAVVRLGLGLGDRLPLFGLTVFALLALIWATSAPDVLGGGE